MTGRWRGNGQAASTTNIEDRAWLARRRARRPGRLDGFRSDLRTARLSSPTRRPRRVSSTIAHARRRRGPRAATRIASAAVRRLPSRDILSPPLPAIASAHRPRCASSRDSRFGMRTYPLLSEGHAEKDSSEGGGGDGEAPFDGAFAREGGGNGEAPLDGAFGEGWGEQREGCFPREGSLF
ncbi:uncharacterized protein SCHCODRAFT_01270930 [Schizophyllum commune H4-8]|uniref:uncharacterized protein n=1 Tax=Schizophyllum commune (strain H4-8 / FGSC 9210) TaxID=578458 RepID=UPI00215DEB5D|nr:uncharacterized protein SCHCODRAFT_01270930 [Schizophyllum commune H4-8]KAI5899798.1 hypothetical protein SCHCODRAFT_01270930 [Schizophyllum commune H4-8]